MTRDFLGASYAAAVPDGESAGFFADHVETLTGATLPTCGEGLLLAPTAGRVQGRFCFAGKGHNVGNAWLWNGLDWIDLKVEAYGANEGSPCAFFGDRLYVSSVGAANNVKVFDALTGALLFAFSQDIGTEGIARVDASGAVYPQRFWYGNHGFGRYVEIGDVRIGQGPRGGLIAQIANGPIKLLEAGPWQFIGVQEAAGVFSVAASQFNYDSLRHDRGAVRSYDRLAIEHAIDYDVAMPPQPPPIVIVPPIILPKPEPVPMSLPDYSRIVKPFLSVRVKKLGSTEATDQRSFAALNACCRQLQTLDSKFGLLQKTGGHQQRNRSVDVFAYDLKDGTCQLVKVIHDAEGAEDGPTVVWSVVDDHGIRPISDWKVPYADIPDPLGAQPDPDPDPPKPDPVDLAPVLAELAHLKALVSDQQDFLTSLLDKVTVLEQKPAPVMTLPKLRAKGELRLSLARVQQINLPVEIVP